MQVRCKICENKNNIFFQKYKGSFLNITDLRKCKKCGVVYAFPYPDSADVEKYYKDGSYFSFVSNQNKKSLKISQKIINQSRINFISSKVSFKKIFKVLDIGSGNANFGLELKKNFSHVTYDIVEPDQSIFKENSNLITNFYLNINEIVNEKYDLIILNFVVEHLIDPASYISKTKELLNEGGLIYIEIPNSEYEYKNSYTPHLFFWNLDSFKFFLKSKNFHIIFANTFGMDFENAKKYFNAGKEINKYLKLNFYFLKLYSLLFPENHIKNSQLILNLYKTNGKRNWIKALIQKNE